jgi:LysR family glycine cleavage system transcriptional activator
LLDLSITPVASPKLVGRRRLTPSDLRAHTLIDDEMGRLYDGQDFWALWLEAAGANKLKVRHGAQFSHTMMALEAAVEGVGVLCTTPELARPQLESRRLVAPFELRLPLGYAYYLVFREKALARAPVRAFTDWLRGEAAR